MSAVGIALAATEEILANKGRTLVSMLSVVIGVATITIVAALGGIGEAAATAILERQSGRPATTALQLTDPSRFPEPTEFWIRRFSERALFLGVNTVSPAQPAEGEVVVGNRRALLQVSGVGPEMAEIRRFRIVAGRWLQGGDSASFSPTLVINRAAAADLGFTPTSTFRQILIDLNGFTIAARIVGVVDDSGTGAHAYLPIEALISDRAPPPEALNFVAWLPPERQAEIVRQLQNAVSRWGMELTVQRTDDPRGVAETVGLFELIFGAVAAVALVAGGLGILNLGLVTIRQRSQEFGVRRAFGASARAIFAIVLLEALFTTTLAGAVGVSLAVVGTGALPFVVGNGIDPADIPPFPVPAALFGLSISLVLGLLAGVVPAVRATQAPVIEAVRN